MATDFQGGAMKTIIDKHLSSMLDELLQKALEEKPKIKTKNSFTYNYFKVWKDEESYEISMLTRKNNPESMGMNIPYFYDLTDYQKEMIDKILKKWSK